MGVTRTLTIISLNTAGSADWRSVIIARAYRLLLLALAKQVQERGLAAARAAHHQDLLLRGRQQLSAALRRDPRDR